MPLPHADSAIIIAVSPLDTFLSLDVCDVLPRLPSFNLRRQVPYLGFSTQQKAAGQAGNLHSGFLEIASTFHQRPAAKTSLNGERAGRYLTQRL